jgi:uncharacterized membrane protein YkoI
MPSRNRILYYALAGLLTIAAPSVRAQSDAKGDADLAKALQSKHVALSAGLSGAAASGKPISVMFEYEDAKLKLSVFVQKAGTFSEVFVDPASGKVLSVEKLTEDDDIKITRKYSAAIQNAKLTLESALQKALAANPGYTGVKVIPAIKNGYVVAQITLIKGTTFKTLTEPLA